MAVHKALFEFSSCGLFSRMELPVFLLDEFLVDVRVDLRGADVCVSEEFL